MFYQPDGELIKDKLNELLGEEKNNVVAWFKYKKNRRFGFRFSTREKMLHEELSTFLNISPSLFTCLLSTSQSDTKSTQIFSHGFVNIQGCIIKMIPMHINNLGDSYHIYQPNTKPSDVFMKLYRNINKDQSVLDQGKNIHETLKKELAKSISGLQSTDVALWKVRKEVNELNNKLRKSVLALYPWPSVDAVDANGKLSELQVLAPADLSTSLSDTCNDSNLNSSTAVVDLTLSDEDEDSSGESKLPNNQINIRVFQNIKDTI